ncbi:hypothetical protein VNO77_33456 [Canavalia gladiata]|uniref:Uncharacterized protein n=1 Tax=Canavalia gladiata TaxID=3824 RepID=A0AAN9KDT2_CANGL
MERFKSGQIITDLALAKGVHSCHSNFYYLHVDFRSRFDINISGIASRFSSCQNDHNKSAFSWFLMKRNRELPGVFQASSSRDLKPTGFYALGACLLLHLIRRLCYNNSACLLLPDLWTKSVVLSLELKLQLQLLPTDESQVTELEILNALALGCYPTLYSVKE